MRTIERLDAAEIRQTQAAWRADPEKAQRHPHLVAQWLGGDRSRVGIQGKELGVNGPGELGPMQLVLAALASCEIDVIATHAALAGLEPDDITFELDAHFDARCYMGVDGPPPGYDTIAYTVRVRASGATAAQRALLQEAIERRSPVGESLTRRVELKGTVEVTG